MVESAQGYRFTVGMDRFARVRGEASRLHAVCEVAAKIRAGFETHSQAREVERVPGVIYSFPPGTLDFNMQIGSARLLARFVVTTEPEDRDIGRRVYSGRYVFELLPTDTRETVGETIYAVSFEFNGAMRIGDFAGDGSNDMNIENDRDSNWMFFALTEANIFASLYPSFERFPKEENYP